MNEKPVIYDAPGEYAKEQRLTSGPRNVPAHIMGQMRGAALQQLIGNPMTQAAVSPGFSGEIAKWNTFSKDQKLEKLLEFSDPEQIRAAMIMEEDNEMLRTMVDRKEDLEKERAV